ncbi:MAG: helix-turn-helix transcriptional regulator [Clostridia bacterium]|nr:helix-turn-helix transcriptional regulator [Clostridia bacterium]
MNEFCQRLKTLRLSRNLTQSEVAAALNVTTQAVSKWESQICLPDIALLIPIADFYGVTVDYLLGHDITEKEKEISDYLTYYDSNFAFYHSEEWNDEMQKARKMLRKYPSDHRLMLVLCSTLLMFYKRCDPDSKYLTELLELCEHIISQNTDTPIRHQATQWMIYAYYELGLYENVKKIVDTMPDLSLSKEALQYYCSKYGTKENLVSEQLFVYKCFSELCERMLKYGTDADSQMNTLDEKVSLCQTVADMVKAYHPDADYDGYTLEYLYRSEMYLALYAATENDMKKSINHLENALVPFEKNNYFTESEMQHSYTSPFLNELSAPLGCNKSHYQKLFREITCHTAFDVLRKDAAFKNIAMRVLDEL